MAGQEDYDYDRILEKRLKELEERVEELEEQTKLTATLVLQILSDSC